MTGVRIFHRLTWLTIAAMFLLAIVVWPSTAERIPVHFDINGQPDRYGGRAEALLLTPVITLVTTLLMLLAPRVDPNRANYRHFAIPFASLILGIALVMAAIHVALVLTALGVPVDIMRVVPIAIGGLFILIGQVMPSLRPNWFAGVRTPWTLSNPEVWQITHRLGGRAFILAGVAFLLAGLIGQPWALITALGILGVAVLGLIPYSYILWRQLGGDRPAAR